jgi:hypothetical protein
VKAGPEDDRVHLTLGAVGGHDRGLADLPDRRRDELDVRLLERRIPVIGREDPLAPDAVLRRHVGQQPGIGDL